MEYRFVVVFYIVLIATLVTAQEYETIIPENASRLERVAQLGYGSINEVRFEDDETVVIGNSYGGDEWQYDTNDMSAPPIFRPAIISPITELGLQRDYGNYNSSKDGRWHVASEGVWSAETGEKAISFMGKGSIGSGLLIANYLVVWRSNYREDKSILCSLENPCGHHIVIMNTFTQQVYDELFLDDVLAIKAVLNDTHIAVIREESTEFYSLQRSDGLELAFTIPASVKYIKGNYGLEYQRETDVLTLWNLQTQAIQMQLSYLESENFWSHNISGNERYLAVAMTTQSVEPNTLQPDYYQKKIGIWDIQTGERLSLIDYFAPTITMEFSDDGQYFVAYSQGSTYPESYPDTYFITLFESQTGRQLFQMDNGYFRPASAIAFSPDLSLFAITFYDGRIVLIDTASGDTLADIAGYGGYIEHINFYEGQIITSSSDGYSDWWDIDTFAHDRRDEDCYILAIRSIDSTVLCNRLWRINLGTYEEDIAPAKFKHIVTNEETEFEFEFIADTTFTTALFNPNGQTLITLGGTIDYKPVVWDARTYEYITTLDDPHFLDDIYASNISRVWDMQYLTFGAYIGSRRHGVIWNAETFAIATHLPQEVAPFSLGAYSEAGDWVAFPNANNTSILVWQLSDVLRNLNPEPIAELDEYETRMLTASPDGRLLAVGKYDDTTLIEMENFTVVHQYRASGLNIQFSPDGRYLVHGDDKYFLSGVDESLIIGSAQVWAVPSN